MRIDKMRVRHAESLGLGVHECGKARAVARNMPGERKRRVVPGHKKQPRDKLLHRAAFTRRKVHRRAFNIAVFRADIDALIAAAVLKREDRSHELRRAGNGQLHIRILFIDGAAAGQNNGAFRADRRCGRGRRSAAHRKAQRKRRKQRRRFLHHPNNMHHPFLYGQCLLLTGCMILLRVWLTCSSAFR